MAGKDTIFGTTPAGEAVARVTIGDEALSASIIGYGAALQALHLPGFAPSLCLGYPGLEAYRTRGGIAGAIVGRVVNRIGHGCAMIDGVEHRFDRNESGRHTLHGGSNGLATRVWELEEVGERFASFIIEDPSGTNGFPGTLTARARYEIHPGGILRLTLEATSNAPTLCNLAPHPYFNLDGGGDARRQSLRIDADAVLAVDEAKIPTGARLSVAGTTLDHRQPRPMIDGGAAYDHNYCLSERRVALRPVARLAGAQSGISMEVRTTEPGLQVYDGAGLDTPYAGIALEPQGWPDAPNHSGFPGIELRPGAVSRQVTEFAFTRSILE